MYDINFMDFVNFRLIPILKRLSDPQYQIRVWGKKHPEYRDSYAEAYEEILEVYQFFGEADELGMGSLNKKNLFLLRVVKEKITDFKISDEEYKRTESLVINPKWIEIQKLAGQLLKSVKEEMNL